MTLAMLKGRSVPKSWLWGGKRTAKNKIQSLCEDVYGRIETVDCVKKPSFSSDSFSDGDVTMLLKTVSNFLRNMKNLTDWLKKKHPDVVLLTDSQLVGYVKFTENQQELEKVLGRVEGGSIKISFDEMKSVVREHVSQFITTMSLSVNVGVHGYGFVSAGVKREGSITFEETEKAIDSLSSTFKEEISAEGGNYKAVIKYKSRKGELFEGLTTFTEPIKASHNKIAVALGYYFKEMPHLKDEINRRKVTILFTWALAMYVAFGVTSDDNTKES